MDKTIETYTYQRLYYIAYDCGKECLRESPLRAPGGEETVDSFIEAGKRDMYFYDIFIFIPTFPLHFP